MEESLEQRVVELEKKVAELEGQVPAQPRVFDSKKFRNAAKDSLPLHLNNIDLCEGSTVDDILKVIAYSLQQALKGF